MNGWASRLSELDWNLFASYFTMLYLSSAGNESDNSHDKNGLMIILCRARKIKAMTYAKSQGNRIFEKICNVIETGFISLE